MKIQKRDGSFQEFNGQKIATAIQKAFQSGDTEISPAILQEIVREITRQGCKVLSLVNFMLHLLRKPLGIVLTPCLVLHIKEFRW